MQLNSLTLNPYTLPPQSKFQLAIYDHKLAVVNREIFVLGKNIQNFSIQTPLHKINLETLTVQPVYTLNPPTFEDFIMFSFEQNIYFWGKTQNSQINQLFQFDGCKFTKMDQKGPIPQGSGHYSYTKFSSKYVLLFSSLVQDQFKIKWYLFDIKKRQWKTIISDTQIPLSQKSNIIWLNGRGYLLLSSVYEKNTKQFKKNALYQLRFKSFSKLILEIREIPLSQEINSHHIVFTNLISFNEQKIYILGGEDISHHHTREEKQEKKGLQFGLQKPIEIEHFSIPCQKVSQKIDSRSQTTQQKIEQEINFNQNKIVYNLDLESYQWSKNCQTIPIQGQSFEIALFQHKIYVVGGVKNLQLMTKIQSYDFRSKQEKKRIQYEQSQCYYCGQAFTYNQSLITQPIVQNQYEKFCPKNQIENKFIKKLSQSINTELHAIGNIYHFLINQQCKQIHMDLCEYINPQENMKMAKKNIENSFSQLLIMKGISKKKQSEIKLRQFFSNVSQLEESCCFQGLQIAFMQLKIASYKIGQGFLYVTSTEQGSIFVGYSSYSQIHFPELNYRSFSENYYTIQYDRITNKFVYSSSIQRHIVYENVKLHFGCPEEYQNLKSFGNNKNAFTNIYLTGITNLQKKVTQQSNYSEDILVKSLPRNPFNSLRRYLQHSYLNQSSNFKIFIQNKQIEMIGIYEAFQELKKSKQIFEIPTNEESLLKKSQNEETHFSTNHDDIVIDWKRIEIIERCRLYEIRSIKKNSIDQIYKNIYVYHSKKLIKTITGRRKNLCGIIELKQNLQVELNLGQFANRKDEVNIIKWIEQLEKSIANQAGPLKEEF